MDCHIRTCGAGHGRTRPSRCPPAKIMLMLSRHAIMTFRNIPQTSILQPYRAKGGLGNTACMCAPAATQLFPGRAVPRNRHRWDYVSCCGRPQTPRLDPTPAASAPGTRTGAQVLCVYSIPSLHSRSCQPGWQMATDSTTGISPEIRPHRFAETLSDSSRYGVK
jgi:hypothetical protein